MAQVKPSTQNKTKVAVEPEPVREGSRGRWVLGWVIMPGTIIGAIFLAGVHVGANHPDMWLSRLIAWLGA